MGEKTAPFEINGHLYTGKTIEYFVVNNQLFPDGIVSEEDVGRKIGKKDFLKISRTFITHTCITFRMPIRGYKAFNEDWTCRSKQYRVGELFEEKYALPIPCCRGMHFCTKISDLFNYYEYNPSRMKIAEVVAEGRSSTDDMEKFCTNKLRILREVSLEELHEQIRELMTQALRGTFPNTLIQGAFDRLRRADEAEFLHKDFVPLDTKISDWFRCSDCEHSKKSVEMKPCSVCFHHSCWTKKKESEDDNSTV